MVILNIVWHYMWALHKTEIKVIKKYKVVNTTAKKSAIESIPIDFSLCKTWDSRDVRLFDMDVLSKPQRAQRLRFYADSSSFPES